jgi:hypothetical protein
MKHGLSKTLVATAASSVLLLGCGLGDRSKNIQPGEADYPLKNPNPMHVIQLTVIAPPSIDFRFLLGYAATSSGGTMQSGTACAYAGSWGGPTQQFSVLPSLEWKRQGDVYRTQVVIDRYDPGRCGWGFAGMWYFVPSTNTDSRRDLFFYDSYASKAADFRMDLWCHDWPNKPSSQSPDCDSIQAFKSATTGYYLPAEQVLPKATYDEIVKIGGQNESPIRVGNEAQSITIQFHDMRLRDGDLAIRSE